MELSTTLEVALIMASFAVVIFVIGAMVMVILAKRKIDQIESANAQLRADIAGMIPEVRELIGNINQLTTRANQQMEQVGQVVDSVQEWTEKGNEIIGEVESMVMPIVQNARRYKAVAMAVLNVLFPPRTRTQSQST